jgi:purine nucleosidase
MQFGQTKPPRGIVYDSNFGETIDTVLALALLHGFDGKNKARIASLSTSKANLKSAQLCDVIENFYASATTGIAALFFTGLPVGLATGNSPDTPILGGTLTRQDDKGQPVYKPRIHSPTDTAVPEVLMRNALLAQYDGNASVVLAGPATNLARLLALRGCKEIIAAKVSKLVLTADGFRSDPAAAKYVTAGWPTPIVLCDREVPAQLLYPGESIEKDFAYSTAHPIADAYRAAHSMPYNAPAAAMAAMLYAIQPDENYFKLSDQGSISVGDDGQAIFRVSPEGKHQSLMVDPARKDEVIQICIAMASAKPVPRSFRRQQQQENADKNEQKNQ